MGPPWISNLVVACRKSGEVRLCVDLKSVNKAIIPDKYPLPTIEELSVEFHHSTVFTKLISSVLSGIDGCINVLDDIVIHGRTKNQRDKRLQLALDRLVEYHITLNPDNCELARTEIDFLGYHVSSQGVLKREDH